MPCRRCTTKPLVERHKQPQVHNTSRGRANRSPTPNNKYCSQKDLILRRTEDMAYTPSHSPTPTSTRSSIKSRHPSVQEITNSPRASPLSSSYYRQQTLRSNNIILEEGSLDEERWSRQAFALGMPVGDIHRPNPEARKFAQKVQKRPHMSERQLTDLLLSLIQASTKSHRHLQVKANTTFHRVAVPNGSGSHSSHKPRSTPLPVPTPNIVVGYTQSTFTRHELELQNGLICNTNGEPCDLAQISQPISEVFWPFFVVDIQPESLSTAQNASAGSAATCNNALVLLAEATEASTVQRQGRECFWKSRRAMQSFSLSISGNLATLNLHSSQGGRLHHAAAIRSYYLEDERDMEALLSRIGSIFVWAENCRLASIQDLLQRLDNIVQLEAREHVSDAFSNEKLISVTEYGSVSPRRRFGGLKSMLAEISPKWTRAQT